MTASAPATLIGHNSVQIPHDGVLQKRDRPVATLAGARFHKKSLFRPTAMSVAMAAAGVLPGTHLIAENAMTATVRHRGDVANARKSVHVRF